MTIFVSAADPDAGLVVPFICLSNTMSNKNLSPDFSWELVTHGLHGEPNLRSKLRDKLSVLTERLQHFDPATVHLHIALEALPHGEGVQARLRLRVPGDTLLAEQRGDDAVEAFDLAVAALERQLSSHVHKLRGEAHWRRRLRQEKERRGEDWADFAEQPLGLGELAQPEFHQTVQRARLDALRRQLEAEKPRLLRTVQRLLANLRRQGRAQVIVDAIEQKALAPESEKPAELTDRGWFYRLAVEQVRDCPPAPAHQTTAAAAPGLLARVEAEFAAPLEREVFELYYIADLGMADVCAALDASAGEVESALAEIGMRLRELLQSEV